MANPFEYSDPVVGDSFADRKAELQTLTARMLTGQNVVVISPRRYGKTSLILNAQARVRRRGGRTGIANLFWCRTRQDVAQELANAAVRGPLGWLRGRIEEMRRRLATLPGATLTVERVSEPDMTAFLRQRAGQAGKEMTPEAATLLYARARGVPAYVQRLAFEAFESVEGGIDEAAVERAVATVLKRERQYLEVIYEDLAQNQRSLVRALAVAPERSITSREFLDRSGLRADSSAQRALAALEASEKVELGPDGWQVTDPLFALWLARLGGVEDAG